MQRLFYSRCDYQTCFITGSQGRKGQIGDIQFPGGVGANGDKGAKGVIGLPGHRGEKSNLPDDLFDNAFVGEKGNCIDLLFINVNFIRFSFYELNLRESD